MIVSQIHLSFVKKNISKTKLSLETIGHGSIWQCSWPLVPFFGAFLREALYNGKGTPTSNDEQSTYATSNAICTCHV